jgi:hypothetical protein
MRSRIRKTLNVRANGPWILASALLVALMVAPFAGAFGEGNNVRGGSRNPSPDARRAYTKETEIIANVNTYGTRQSNKSSNGGPEVGAITGPATAAPFTTTAKGVATGLNADQVDGQSASEIVAAAQALNKFADVSSTGTLNAGRGAKAASAAASVYTIDFDSDVSKCARTATVTGDTAGFATTTLTDADTVTVHTFDGGGAAGAHPFHLVVTC